MFGEFFFFFFFHFLGKKEIRQIERGFADPNKKNTQISFPQNFLFGVGDSPPLTDDAEEEENKKRDQTHVITIFGEIHRPSSQSRCCLPHLLLHLLACFCCCCCAVVGGFHVVAVEVGGYKKPHSRKFSLFMIIS
jgi:hypothetical protein